MKKLSIGLLALIPILCLGQISGGGGGKGGSGGTTVGYTNTLFVATNGNDLTATRGGLLPFATPMAARTAALPGDTITVYPGLYTNQTQLTTNLVNWHFFPGTTISNFLDDSNAITTKPFFDDANGAITSVITGKLNLYANFGTNISAGTTGVGTNKHPTAIGSANFNYAMVSLQNSNSILYGNFGTLTIEDRTNLNLRSVINISNCTRSFITADEILEAKVTITYNTNSQVWSYGPPLNGGSIACYWGVGEAYYNIQHIDQGFEYGFWANEPADGITHTNNGYFNCTYSQSKIYTSTPTTNTDAVDSSYRTWINGLTWLHTSNAVAGESCSFYGGYNYLINCGKISDDKSGIGCIGMQGTAKAWINVQKLTANNSYWLKTSTSDANGSPSVYLNCLNYDAPNGVSATGGLLFNGQLEAVLGGGRILVPSGIPVAYLDQTGGGGFTNNGKVYLKEMTIDNSAAGGTTNYPVIIDTNGLYLQNCVIVAPTGGGSIFSSTGQSIGIYGTTMANRPKDANITLSPLGTFTIDSNTK